MHKQPLFLTFLMPYLLEISLRNATFCCVTLPKSIFVTFFIEMYITLSKQLQSLFSLFFI